MSTSLITSLFGGGRERAADMGGNPLDDRYYEPYYPAIVGASAYGRMSPAMAMKVSAVYRCVSIRANVMATMPEAVYEDVDRDGEAGEKRRAPEHPMDLRLRLKPNPRQTAFEWRRQLNVSLLLRQNAYCQMVPTGRAGQWDLYPLHPDRISKPEEVAGGYLRYEYRKPGGETVGLIGGVDIWHLQGLSEDGLQGLALTSLAAQTFQLAATAETHAARFFGRGVKANGVLEHPGRLKRETAEEMGDSFGRRYGGEAGMGKVPVLWEGMKFTPITMSNKDAEFLDSRKFQVSDIARWFGIPPYLLSDVEKSTSWGTGIEEQNLAFLAYTLTPDITLWEQRVRHDLLLEPERFYLRVNVNALLRAKTSERFAVYQTGITNGILSPNECREMEDLNAREGGDEYLTPLNMRQGAQEPPAPDPTGLQREQGRALTALAERLALEAERPARRRKAARAHHALTARAQALARRAAAGLVEVEVEQLLTLAKDCRSDEQWRHRVASFYGRHAAVVAEALAVEPEAAKAWCRARQDELQTVPAAVDRAARAETLVALALSDAR